MKLFGDRTSTNSLSALQNKYFEARLRQITGSYQPVVSGANDDCVNGHLISLECDGLSSLCYNRPLRVSNAMTKRRQAVALQKLILFPSALPAPHFFPAHP